MSGQYEPTEMKILIVEIAIRTVAATCSAGGELVLRNLGLTPALHNPVWGTSQGVIGRAIV